eukprot:6520986-Pyramimonas_sp.AAC.1
MEVAPCYQVNALTLSCTLASSNATRCYIALLGINRCVTRYHIPNNFLNEMGPSRKCRAR